MNELLEVPGQDIFGSECVVHFIQFHNFIMKNIYNLAITLTTLCPILALSANWGTPINRPSFPIVAILFYYVANSSFFFFFFK